MSQFWDISMRVEKWKEVQDLICLIKKLNY